MYLSCQLFFKSPHKTLKIPTKIAAAANKKIYVNMTEWRYSQLIFTEKKMFINNVQDMLLQTERVSEMHFPVIFRPEFQKKKKIPLLSTLGIPHGDSEPSKL